MDVMMDVLAGNDRHDFTRMLAFQMHTFVAEPGCLRVETSLDFFSVVMLKFASFDCEDVELMLLFQRLRVDDGLD